MRDELDLSLIQNYITLLFYIGTMIPLWWLGSLVYLHVLFTLTLACRLLVISIQFEFSFGFFYHMHAYLSSALNRSISVCTCWLDIMIAMLICIAFCFMLIGLSCEYFVLTSSWSWPDLSRGTIILQEWHRVESSQTTIQSVPCGLVFNLQFWSPSFVFHCKLNLSILYCDTVLSHFVKVLQTLVYVQFCVQ